MRRAWVIIAVLLYPVLTTPYLFARLDRFNALASGFVVFLILWLYVLPRHLAWRLGVWVWESRFVLPLTAYLGGLAVAATLMSFTKPSQRWFD